MNHPLDLLTFLKLFVPADAEGYLELRARNNGWPRDFIKLSHDDAKDRIVAYILECAKLENHPYFGLAERMTTENGKKPNLSWWRMMFVDQDYKLTPKPEADALLAQFPLKPTVLVGSGGGQYPFFAIKPVDLRIEGNIARVEALTRRLVATLHADPMATPVSQLLRLPGTTNTKPEYGPEGRKCQIGDHDLTRVYTIEEFEALPETVLLPDPQPKVHGSPRRETDSIGVHNPGKIISVLSRLWPGELSGLRHKFAQHLGGWLAHQNIDEEDAVDLISSAAVAAGDIKELPDRETAVRDSYATFAKGGSVTGLPKAIGIVSELKEVVDVLQEALGTVPRPLIVVEDNIEAPSSEQLALPEAGRIGLAKEWADLYADAYEAAWENFYFAFLTHLGARVAKHLRLDNDLGTEPRLYSILLAPSGAGKSEAINKATADFAWADLGHAPDPLKPVPRQFSVVHGVGSGEALGEALEEDDRRTVLFQPDEFAHVANKMKIEGSSLTSILNTLFENAAWDNRVRGKKYKIEGASLSFLTACVDDVFPTLFDPRGGADQGIVNRFWIVAGPSSAEPKPSPRVDPVVLGQIRQRLYQMLRPFQSMGREEHVVVRYAPEARALYENWYRTEYFQQRGASLVRLRTYVQRFTMLLALSTTEGVILSARGLVAGPEVVQAAVSMARWQARMRQRFMPIIADNAGAKVEMTILRVFRQTGGQGLTRRDAQRLTSASRVGTSTWNRAFDALCVNGNLVPLEPLLTTPSEKGGRPQSPRFRLAFSD